MQVSRISRVETCFTQKEKGIKRVCTFYFNTDSEEKKVLTFFRFHGDTFYLQGYTSVLNARLMERRGFPDER